MFHICTLDGIAMAEKDQNYTNHQLRELRYFLSVSPMVLMKGGKVCHFG